MATDAERAFHDSVMHQLTRQLLEAQHRNVSLQAENREMRYMLESGGGAAAGAGHAGAGSGGAAAAGAGAATAAEAIGDETGAGGGAAAEATAGEDVDALVGRIHAALDEQARHAMLRKQSGLCCLSHEEVRAVVQRCTAQLGMLDTLHARRRTELTKRVDSADEAAVSALGEQLRALKRENTALRTQVGALKQDVARLGDEAEEAKKLRLENAELDSKHGEATSALRSQVHELTKAKAELDRELRASKEQCMLLQNQLDDMNHLREEKNELERAFLAQQQTLARVHAEKRAALGSK